jgi:Ca2+-binding RTX toxin-like protein
MSFSVVLTDAAAQYGISDQSAGLGAHLESVIGTETSASASWGSGQLTIGQSGTVTFAYSNGFSLALTFTQQSATTATVTEADLFSPQHVKLVSYAGSLSVTSTTLATALTDSNALAGNDTITGNGSNDTLEGYGGNDTINGGGGIDTVVLSGSHSAYSVTNSSGTITTSGTDGTDTLTNVERLHFDDESLAFDTSGDAGQAYRLYQAALDRAPEAAGLGFYIDTLAQGWQLHDIAQNFLQSPEFQANYGNLTDRAFVEQLYLNVLHRAGEESGILFHINELALGLDRAQVLINFSESPENQANLIGVMSQGMAFIP